MKTVCKTLVLLLAFTVYSTTSAQTEREVKEDVSVGINMASLLFQNTQPMPYVCGLWAFKPNQQIRLQLGFNSNEGSRDYQVSSAIPFSTVQTDTTGNNNPSASQQVGVSFAYLQSRQLNNTFDFYFGLDFGWSKATDSYTMEYTAEQDFGNGNKNFFDVKEKLENNSKTMGASPVAGVTWKVNDRFGIGVETQASFQIQTSKEVTDIHTRQTSSFNPNEFVQDTHRVIDDRNVITRLLPVGGFFVYVRL